MILISHRGNINGRNPEKENSVRYVLDTLDKGYDCEVDVWYQYEEWSLGHDKPQYPIAKELLLKYDGLWCHAKNIEALVELKKYGVHTFWHDTDKYTITSREIIWQYPNPIPVKNTVCVLPEWNDIKKNELKNCLGVCSDYIEEYK